MRRDAKRVRREPRQVLSPLDRAWGAVCTGWQVLSGALFFTWLERLPLPNHDVTTVATLNDGSKAQVPSASAVSRAPFQGFPSVSTKISTSDGFRCEASVRIEMTSLNHCPRCNLVATDMRMRHLLPIFRGREVGIAAACLELLAFCPNGLS